LSPVYIHVLQPTAAAGTGGARTENRNVSSGCQPTFQLNMDELVETHPVSYSVSLWPDTRRADLGFAKHSAIARGQVASSRLKHRFQPLLLFGNPIVPWYRLMILTVVLFRWTNTVILAGMFASQNLTCVLGTIPTETRARNATPYVDDSFQSA
jgi:hypothetical protein